MHATGSRSVTPTPGDIRNEEKLSGESAIAYIQRAKHQCDAETWKQFMLILSRQNDDQKALDAVGIYLQDFIYTSHVEKWEL